MTSACNYFRIDNFAKTTKRATCNMKSIMFKASEANKLMKKQWAKI